MKDRFTGACIIIGSLIIAISIVLASNGIFFKRYVYFARSDSHLLRYDIKDDEYEIRNQYGEWVSYDHERN